MRLRRLLLLLLPLAGLEIPALAEEGQAPPVVLEAAYTSDLWTVVGGGVRSDVRYLDDLAVALSVDGERTLGWRGGAFHASLLYNNGTTFSEDVVGDVQAVSNIEAGTRALRLYEAWVDQQIGERLSLRFGLYDLNSEFDANETGALFLNSSHGIGPDFSQSGRNGPSIFPVTALALRADWAIDEDLRVRAAILDAVPGDPDRPKRTAILLRREEGALFVGELERRWSGGKVTVGHWAYGRRAPRLSGDGDGTASGTYLLAEHRLAGGRGGPRTLSGWLRVGVADPDVHAIAAYLGAGLVLSGPLPGRERDALGLALAHVRFSRVHRRIADVERGELDLELTYRAALSDRLSVQPDLQLILDPSGVRGRPTAIAVGLRTELRF